MTTSAEGPAANASAPVVSGGTAVSAWQYPTAWASPTLEPGQSMPVRNRRCLAWGASSLVALPADASSALVSGAGAAGKNRAGTTPQAAQMNKLKTGFSSAAQAERSGRLSKKGSARVAPAAPLKNARR